jgi:hypothetical protein
VISEQNLFPMDSPDIRRQFRTYALSPSGDSATSVRYTATRCFTDQNRAKIAAQMTGWSDREKIWMTTWLAAAATQRDWLRTQPSPGSAASSTPFASPGNPSLPTATATPLALR